MHAIVLGAVAYDAKVVPIWDGFKAHPLRKDYPVTGRGEREKYPILSRDSA